MWIFESDAWIQEDVPTVTALSTAWGHESDTNIMDMIDNRSIHSQDLVGGVWGFPEEASELN